MTAKEKAIELAEIGLNCDDSITAGYAYLITMVGSPYVKVGITRQEPKVRLSKLQTGNPLELKFLACEKTQHPRGVESELNTRFRQSSVRGEWYELDNETALSGFYEAKHATQDNAWNKLDMVKKRLA